MKQLFVIIIFIGTTLKMNAQLYPLRPQLDTISFQIINAEGQLTIESNQFPKKSEFPDIIALYLESGDLVLEYKFNGKHRNFTPDIVKIITLTKENETNTSPQKFQLSQSDKLANSKKGVFGEIRWKDIIEEHLIFGQRYDLIIERNIRIRVNCEDVRPHFDFKIQLPNYAIGSAAIASLVLSINYRNERDRSYNEYTRLWSIGEPSSNAEPFLQDAQQYDKAAKITTYVGIGIAIADVAWLIFRVKNMRDRQLVYDQFCNGNLSYSLFLSPSFDGPQPFNVVESGMIGGRLSYSF